MTRSIVTGRFCWFHLFGKKKKESWMARWLLLELQAYGGWWRGGGISLQSRKMACDKATRSKMCSVSPPSGLPRGVWMLWHGDRHLQGEIPSKVLCVSWSRFITYVVEIYCAVIIFVTIHPLRYFSHTGTLHVHEKSETLNSYLRAYFWAAKYDTMVNKTSCRKIYLY